MRVRTISRVIYKTYRIKFISLKNPKMEIAKEKQAHHNWSNQCGMGKAMAVRFVSEGASIS